MRSMMTTVLLVGVFCQAVRAYNAPEVPGTGPYSSAQAKYKPGAIDQGIAGFVGPHGDGQARLPGGEDPDTGELVYQNPNNYVNPIFKGWATSVVSYLPSDVVGPYGQNGIGSQFGDPAKALGTVTGDNFHIVSLGDRSATEIANNVDPGTLTLSFAAPISNGSGADFAVFENGFISAGGAGVAGQVWAELAYCEVSSDGVNFARFPSVSLTAEPVGAYGTVDPTNVYNLAGKHVNAYGSSWGTPFDLNTLADHALVQSGSVDLNNINYVRLVDIAGNGSQLDSQGRPIYDGWLTWGSGGADIDAIGAIRHFGEAQSAAAGAGAAGWGWNCREGALRLEYKGLSVAGNFNATVCDEQTISLLSSVGTVLHAWTIDDGGASFDADGGIRLFAYFDPSAFTGDSSLLRLMQWDGAAWRTLGIESMDVNNFMLQSQWLGEDATSFAVVVVPEPALFGLLGAAGGFLLMRRRRSPL